MARPATEPGPPNERALRNERRDDDERRAAAADDLALVAYQSKWQRRLRRLQQGFPERWRVPGLSDEEVVDRLTLRLIEAVRHPTAVEQELRRPGREWGLLIARIELRALRKTFRLATVPVDFAAAVCEGRAPSQEESFFELETEHGRRLAQARAEERLSRPQRRWLSALKLSALAGDFFAASAEPNLSAAARLLGKNRSSAQRSYRELQLRFRRELERLR